MSNITETTQKVSRKDGSHVVACFPEQYTKQINEKVDRLRGLLKWTDHIDVYESPKSHYRMRANFQLWHDNPKNKTPEGLYYCMYADDDKKTPCEIKEFPRGTKLINRLMNEITAAIKESKLIFEALFEVRFLTTQTEQAVVVLLYKRQLPQEWKAEAEKLCAKLNIKIIGRARKQIVVCGDGDDETVIETYTVKGKSFHLYQTEGAFSQPNAAVCEKMIEWSMDRTEGSQDEDLLELYCGGGTFTIPMARQFKRVLATEISKASVDLASRAIAKNGVENIKIARLSSEEFSEAYSKGRKFERLVQAKIDVKQYQITTVLVDPPRAGLDDGTCQIISQFDKIVYISCNPETLARDVEKLKSTHEVQRVAAFDQFPYTHHLESGVFLVKKKEAAVVEIGDDGSENAEKRARLNSN